MKYLICLLLLSFAVYANDQGPATPPPATAPSTAAAPADAAPALSDDELLAQQLVRCGLIAQKLGTSAQTAAGWLTSYDGAAIALTSAAFVGAQVLSQAGSADSLSRADLENASAQCQLLMLTNMQRIGAALKARQGSAKQ